MNHDYFALKIHETRVADLRAEARHERAVGEVLRARRALARLTRPTAVVPLRPRDRRAPGAGQPEGRDAA